MTLVSKCTDNAFIHSFQSTGDFKSGRWAPLSRPLVGVAQAHIHQFRKTANANVPKSSEHSNDTLVAASK